MYLIPLSRKVDFPLVQSCVDSFLRLFGYAVFFAFATLLSATAQQPVEPPQDLAHWTAICYCNFDHGSTPRGVLKADDNGRVLYLARNGATRAQIEAEIGHPVATSQLIALVDWRLLTSQNGVYKTAIPVLGPEQIGPVRAALRLQAKQALPSLLLDIESLKRALAEQGYADSLYTLTFSYALDGVFWNQLKEKHVLREVSPSKDRPFWDGSFWVSYPERKSFPGTNTISPGAKEYPLLSLLWTDHVLPRIVALENVPQIEAVTERLGQSDCRNLQVTDTGHRTWNFDRQDGRCAIPVIRQTEADPIYASSFALAARVVGILEKADLTALTAQGIPAEDARIIAAHELIWTILDELEAKHIVQPPAVLSTPELSNETAPFMPLMFVTVDK
jgi:hypothetical protein